MHFDHTDLLMVGCGLNQAEHFAQIASVGLHLLRFFHHHFYCFHSSWINCVTKITLNRSSRIRSLICILFLRLRLAGSKINWQKVWFLLKISSMGNSGAEFLQIFLYSSIILFLISLYRLQIVKICCIFSFSEFGEQHLQWGDPPERIDFSS